jgi:D-lactate dehydrogenase
LIREEAELISAASPDGHDLSDLVADHVLLRMPNVVVTPHSAYLTREAIERIVAASVENVTAFAAGRPRNLVSPRIPIAT